MNTYNKLVQQHGFIDSYLGKNEDGETVLVDIKKERALVSTYQDNGWIRVNVYYPDGSEEEYYER